jgi:NTP pyrophosphatase (non-canonical NTP hydrolase)
MTYANTEMKVIQWGEARGIVKHSTSLAQANKTQEELNELFQAIAKGNKANMADAYGDIMVTLVMGATIADLDLQTCFEMAYQEIKERTGSLNADGIWVKD